MCDLESSAVSCPNMEIDYQIESCCDKGMLSCTARMQNHPTLIVVTILFQEGANVITS